MSILAALMLLQAQAAPTPPPEPPTPGSIVAAAPRSEWRAISPRDLLVIDLAPKGRAARRVVIQLVPAPFALGWTANIRTLAAAHWWDGTAVVRVQDNYVVQWGDPTEKKPLPAGIATVPERAYLTPLDTVAEARSPIEARDLPETRSRAKWLSDIAIGGTVTKAAREGWHERDSYAEWVEVIDGWPIATDDKNAWMPHCYGMVGVGRNLSPDTGSGAELYTVIGQAPRHLDRNIAIVGRVIAGMEHLSSLARGTGDLGFYKTPGERTPIVRARLASELPAAERPAFEMLATDSETFARYVAARANRRDSFFNVPAGGVDICNLPVPIRPAK
ncbi:peptidylprolyl isomerase [Sphingomonas sp. Y38-1Y]|uniref:peptidylprolyl isomerase n=1 Tax=Sphingomonas sp. Y38-1Y TaxID=3078265 RepID=UPI0028E58762|nr:peptidylprolyl isomerase [Sphingomonas sp. Y38-1Y]